MRRTCILLLLSTLVPSFSLRAQQTLKQLPGPVRLNGPIESIRDEQARVTLQNGSWVEGPRVLQMIWHFSENGTRQNITYYLPDGRVKARAVYIYDTDGRLLESSHYQGEDLLEGRAVNTYDGNKVLIGSVTYRGDGSVLSRTVHKYEGAVDQMETIQYDANGVEIKRTKTNRTRQGLRTNSDSVSLAANGTVARNTISENRSPDGSHDFQYQSSDGRYDRQEVTLGEKGTFERKFYNRDGTILKIDRFVQEFDSYGNMTKSTNSTAEGASQNFHPSSIGYRTITYYGKN